MDACRKIITLLGLLALLFLPVSPVIAANSASQDRAPASWCGTWEWGIEVSLAKRELNQRRRSRQFTVQSGASDQLESAGLRIRSEGKVAVIEDDGTIVIARNPFDYEERGVKFIRKGKKGFKARNLGGSVGSPQGEKLDLGDDDSRRITLPDFQIRFYGQSYSSLFVNSDGNLTFGEPDKASTARDVRRMLVGPPRVSAFFADLDPSSAFGDGGVYLQLTSSKVIITWWNVPNFDERNSNTFRLTMNARGNVEVRFGQVSSSEGVVGVAPGGGSGLELVDLTSDLPIKRKGIAIAERFSNSQNVDESAAAEAFLDRFADDYDQLVMFTDFTYLLGDSPGTIAYHMTVNNQIRGIGRSTYNASRFYGSNGRLGGFINMGHVNKYPNNVNKPSFINDLYSALDVLAHEIGHQWLVGATFLDGAGRTSRNLLGRDSVHWSYYFNSDLSFLEGNKIRDNGNRSFTTQGGRATYNDLDLYFMGLHPAEAVSNFWYVLADLPQDTDTAAPEAGVTFDGVRMDASIEDIVNALGARRPLAADSSKRFNIGIMLVGRPGQSVSAASIEKANKFARGIESLFRKETRGLGRLNVSLIGR